MSQIQIPIPDFYKRLPSWGEEALTDFDNNPDAQNFLYVVHRRGRKTTIALNLELREAASHKKDTYAHIFPTFKQAKAVLWRDPKMLKTYMPGEILAKPFNETELVAEFTSGSVLQIGGADQPDRWRGMGCKGWVLDEFATMKTANMMREEIIQPIIQENHGWVMYLYTPKGRNVGWEYLEKAKRLKWIHKVIRADKSGVFTAQDLIEAKENMPEHLFQQEMMCEFLISGGGVIKRINEAIAGILQPALAGHRYVMGVDLGRKVDWTVLTVIDCDTRQVVGFERFQKIDWSFQKEKIAAMAKRYNNAFIIIDSTGVGDPIEQDLEHMNLGVRGYKFTETSKKQLVEKLILAIEDRRITYPRIPEMLEELEAFDIDEKGHYGAPIGFHDDCVISLGLGVEGLGAEIYSPEQETEGLYQTFEERFSKKVNA
jgi:hypothetical protein